MGFIGSNFIRLLLREEPETKVTNLDLMTYAANPGTLADIPKRNPDRYQLIIGNINDEMLVRRLMLGCDVVVHFAAESHVDRSISHGASGFIQTNVVGTQNLIDAARQAKVPRFIYISTDEVYGPVHVGAAGENYCLNPRNPYAASKAAADHLCLAYHNTYDFPVIITRSANNYGPNQHPEKFIPLAITNLLSKKPIPVYGFGHQRRDWLHVEDNCRAILAVMRKGRTGEVYNIGTGEERTNIDIARRLVDIVSPGDGEWVTHVADRPGHDVRYAMKTDKVLELGWSPTKKLDDGLRETVKWYTDNKPWWGYFR